MATHYETKFINYCVHIKIFRYKLKFVFFFELSKAFANKYCVPKINLANFWICRIKTNVQNLYMFRFKGFQRGFMSSANFFEWHRDLQTFGLHKSRCEIGKSHESHEK